MNMPKVAICEVTDCYYNTRKVCHAPAINVGADHPACDTFMRGSKHGGAMDMIAMVGACKVDHCSYNSNFLCSAPNINVGLHESHADCKTYMAR